MAVWTCASTGEGKDFQSLEERQIYCEVIQRTICHQEKMKSSQQGPAGGSCVGIQIVNSLGKTSRDIFHKDSVAKGERAERARLEP